MSNTILLIEDSADEILLAKRAFDKAGVGVNLSIADCGEQACAWLAAQAAPELPDLVLLDLQMESMNGLAVLQVLRSQPQTRIIPIVLLSSSDEPNDIATAYACGANSYLRKPVNFDDFVDLIRLIHQYWLVRNKLPEPARPPGEPR